MKDGVIKQKVCTHDNSQFKINIVDLKNSQNINEELLSLGRDSQQAVFKLDQQPWIKATLAQLEGNKHVLFISIPHMIFDNQSMNFIKDELFQLYNYCLKGENILLPDVIQYKDYIAEINKVLADKNGEKHREYWMNLLKKLPENKLRSLYSTANVNKNESYKLSIQQESEECFGKLSPQLVSAFYGTVSCLKFPQGAAYSFYIDSRRFEVLKKLSKESNVVMPILLIGTFHLLIYKLTGEKDSIIGINQSLRDKGNLNKVIGFFINIILIRYKIDDSLTLCEYARGVYENFIKILQHKIYPFEKALFDSDVPLHRVGACNLNIISHEDTTMNKENLESDHQENTVFPHFDMDFNISIYNNIIEIHCSYKTDLFTKSTIDFIFDNYLNMIDSFEINPTKTIADLGLINKPKHIK